MDESPHRLVAHDSALSRRNSGSNPLGDANKINGFANLLDVAQEGLEGLTRPGTFLAQVIPNPSSTAVLVQRAALDQSAEMLLQRIAAGASQFDRFTNRDAAMLAGEFDDL